MDCAAKYSPLSPLPNNAISINSSPSIFKSPFGPNNCSRRLSDFLQTELNTTSELANELAIELLMKQKELRRGQAKTFKASQTVLADIRVTKDIIYVLGDEIGMGGASRVYKSRAFATNRRNDENFSPGNPRDVAEKSRKQPESGKVYPVIYPYSPAERKVKEVLRKRELEADSPAADLSYATYKETDPISGKVVAAYSVHELCQHDLSHTEFHRMPNPVFSMLKVLYDVVKDLNKIHSKGKIHRDIKGPNILVKLPDADGEIKGKLTDWDTFSESVPR